MNTDKLKDAVKKEAKDAKVEPKYFFFAYEENGELKFAANIFGKSELHTVVGMLERAKHDFLKMIDRQ